MELPFKYADFSNNMGRGLTQKEIKKIIADNKEVNMKRLNREELLKELLHMNELVQGEYSHSLAKQKRNYQACRQIDELIMCEDMVQQYRDEKDAEQAEIELNYIDIILDLYEQLEAKTSYARRWIEKNRDYWNKYQSEYQRKRYATDPIFREKVKARNRARYKK